MSESLNNVDMHSDEWWMRAMDGALTLEEQRAWEGHLSQCAACREEWRALMELDQLFESVPVAVPSADFTAKTLVRLDATRPPPPLVELSGNSVSGIGGADGGNPDVRQCVHRHSPCGPGDRGFPGPAGAGFDACYRRAHCFW